MPERGRLTEWNDERGFGFVTPLDGGQRLFAHVSEFPRELRRPQLNDLVTYEPAVDERGRPQAHGIRYLTPVRSRDELHSARHLASGRSGHESHERPVSMAALLFCAGFFIVLALFAAVRPLLLPVLAVYAMASVGLFAMYGADKDAAQSGARRIPEDTLHFFSLLGGWPGALVAQTVFRHKTRKQPFRTIFWATVVVNCVILALIVATLASPG